MRQFSRLVLSGLLTVCLFASSGDFQANHIAGEDLLSKKDLSSAILNLEKAWKIDPGNYVNGYDLALAYFEAGRTHESRDLINDLMRHADKAELHNLLADVEESEGHPNEAARQYELAARLDPSEKNVFDLGSDLLKHRAFTSALAVFKFGVERYPESPKTRVGLGIALLLAREVRRCGAGAV